MMPSSQEIQAGMRQGGSVSGDGSSLWTPILTGLHQQHVELVLGSIAASLAESDIVRFYGPSWAGGAAGVALFFHYLSRTRPESELENHATKWLYHSVITPSVVGPSLFAGSAGIAWTVEHIGVASDAIGNADPRRDVDDLLNVQLAEHPWQGEYDLWRGLVGYGVYALSQRGHPNGRELLARVIDCLAETAESTQDGTTWRTGPERLDERRRGQYPDGYYNLGLAHGVPGVIALLGQACAMKVREHVASSLLDQTVSWLLAQRHPDTAESCFGNLGPVTAHGDRTPPSRISWCYGDLGVAAALYVAAVNVSRLEWQFVALDIARRAAARPMERSGAKDATLCHGAAGNGHIFNRLYQATRESVFLDAARQWFERALGFCNPGTGVGGFTVSVAHTRPGTDLLRNTPGVMQGAAGIGLALLAATCAIEPAWDEMLLVSMPPIGQDSATVGQTHSLGSTVTTTSASR